MERITRRSNRLVTAGQNIPKNVLVELSFIHNKVCMLCGQKEISEKLYGLLYEFDDIIVHHYCILLSSRAIQNGENKEGIMGLIKDIKSELMQGFREICVYCNEKGATILCCGRECKKVFHLPCGLKNGSMHQYFQPFKSFCRKHRIVQTIDISDLQNSTPTQCAICKNDVIPSPLPNSIWAPCCKHNAWFHRRCVQDLALSAGYFFRCPLCNNAEEFNRRMCILGIYIPLRDPSWETVPNAYAELFSVRNRTCNAVHCLCPLQDKRTFQHKFGSWQIKLCHACGLTGTHKICSSIKYDEESWYCAKCQAIADNPIKKKQLPNGGNCSGSSVMSEGSVSSQNREVSQQLNSEIMRNRAQDDPILISDSSNNNSIQCIPNVEPSNAHLQVVKIPQIQMPVITSYASLKDITKDHLYFGFLVSTNQSTSIDLTLEDNDSE